jgi:hypothetical protein
MADGAATVAMRTRMLIAVGVMASVAAVPAPSTTSGNGPSTFTFHAHKHAVGEKWIAHETENVDLAGTINGYPSQMGSERTQTSTVEVLETNGSIVTQARYTYDAFKNTFWAGGDGRSPAMPFTGKTYVLTAGDPIGVTASTGTASDDEVELIRKQEIRFGKPDADAMLDGRTFTRGAEVTVPASQLAGVVAEPNMKVAKLSVTYTGIAGDTATFDVRMRLAGGKDGYRVTAELTGAVLVDARDGSFVSANMKGPLTMAADKWTLTGTVAMTEHDTR